MRDRLKKSLCSRAMAGASVTALAATLSWSGAVQAQTTAAQAPDVANVQELVVTSTRVISGFAAPTPTTVIGSQDLLTRGASSVTTVVQELPAINASRSSAASNGVRTQTPGQNFADLRGLGTQRTLVLVDGHRFVPTVPSSSVGSPYQVDLNLIPSLMVDRIDVVTGGASAQWGSDAVAGVLNFVLKKKIEGIQGEIQGGISQRSDYKETRVGLVGGHSFGGGKGHFVVGGDWVKNDGIDSFRDRKWAARQCNLFADPASTLANGLPKQVLACDTQNGNRTAGGLITSTTGGTADQRAALVGLQFISPTQVAPFVRGLYNAGGQTTSGATTNGTFSASQSGGTNPNQEQTSLFLALNRAVVFSHAEYDASDKLNLFVDGSWGRSKGSQVNRPTRDQSGVYNPATGVGSQGRIYADNPFIPAAIRGFIPLPAGPSTAVQPAQSFTVARDDYDFPLPRTTLVDTAWTGTGGFNAKLPSDWIADGSFTHGENIYERQSANARDRSLYVQAVDAVSNPATGRPICRIALTNPSTSCVPINLFGQGTPSPDAFSYFGFTASARVKYIQDAAQINFRGSAFDTWAGPVAVAAGVEWRKESVNSTVGARDALNVADSSVGGAFAGGFNVKEGYLEATVPLAKDWSFARSLAVNGAVRYADYSNFGGNTTWKVGATYEPMDGLLFRGTLSRDVRAPALYELNVPPVRSNQNILFRGRQFTGVGISNVGNTGLQPERSDTFTAGGSFSPRFLPGLQLSVDYFDIRVKDVITTLGPVAIARNCDVGLTSFCSLLGFDAAGNLVTVLDRFQNLSAYNTDGVDLALSFRRPLFGGTFNLRGNATYTHKFEIVAPGVPPVVAQYAGGNGVQLFAVPHWKANFTTSYQRNAWTVAMQARWVGAGRQDTNLIEFATPTSQPDISPATNHVPGYVVFNLGGTIDLLSERRAQFFWNIENLFNRDPLLVPNLSTGIQTNGALYDVVGRYFRAGVRFRM